MSTVIFLMIPVFFLIVAFEWFVSFKQGDRKYSLNSMAMNVAIGAIDRLGSLFTMALLYFVLGFMYDHFALFNFSNPWYQWVGGYIAVDFISYWFHRYSHKINILWAGHITHHSSPDFNLSNGFRTSVFQGLNRIPFWAILPVLGFSPVVLIIIFNISGIYDFFMHTPYFPRYRSLEKVFITPSLHKVHHGKNEIYIDKNYGSTFSVWDRMFGTFQPETEEVEFGITGNYTDNKPVTAITYYYSYLFNALKKSPGKLFPVLFSDPCTQKYISAGEAAGSAENIMVCKKVRSLVLFHLAAGIGIDFISLLMRSKMQTWEFLIFYGIGLVSIISAARILNRSATINFFRNQTMFCILTCVSVLLIYFFTGNNISLGILCYFFPLTVVAVNAYYTRWLRVPAILGKQQRDPPVR